MDEAEIELRAYEMVLAEFVAHVGRPRVLAVLEALRAGLDSSTGEEEMKIRGWAIDLLNDALHAVEPPEKDLHLPDKPPRSMRARPGHSAGVGGQDKRATLPAAASAIGPKGLG